jgi:peptidyl-prolyl cis-trans isomerase C
MNWRHLLLTLVFAGGFIFTGCNAPTQSSRSITPEPPSATPTPTSTPRPLAARVNGEPITLEEYSLEVQRFESAQQQSGLDLATFGNYEGSVLQAMIDELLLSQGARHQGVTLSDAALEDIFNRLAEEIGGRSALEDWLSSHQFTEASFKRALEVEHLAAKMVEKIVEQVPESTEQVHARHILLPSLSGAERILAELQDGADFADLANMESIDASTRPAGGDLGWFPRGYLLIPEVEVAAYELQPGETSGVVQSDLGFHIVQTIERGVHPLSPDALRMAQEKAVQDWLDKQRETADIQLYVTP